MHFIIEQAGHSKICIFRRGRNRVCSPEVLKSPYGKPPIFFKKTPAVLLIYFALFVPAMVDRKNNRDIAKRFSYQVALASDQR